MEAQGDYRAKHQGRRRFDIGYRSTLLNDIATQTIEGSFVPLQGPSQTPEQPNTRASQTPERAKHQSSQTPERAKHQSSQTPEQPNTRAAKHEGKQAEQQTEWETPALGRAGVCAAEPGTKLEIKGPTDVSPMSTYFPQPLNWAIVGWLRVSNRAQRKPKH